MRRAAVVRSLEAEGVEARAAPNTTASCHAVQVAAEAQASRLLADVASDLHAGSEADEDASEGGAQEGAF